MSESKGTKFRKAMFDNLGFITAFIVAIAYLFWGLVTLDGSGKTLSEIIISSLVVWLVGYSIGQTLSLQGILIGEKDQSVIDTKISHGKAIEKMGSDITYLEYFCVEQTREALKTARTARLSRVGLKYNDYFDKDDCVIEDNIYIAKSDDEIKEARNKIKRKAIEEAIYMQVTPLTVESLTTDNGSKYDPYNYGKDKLDYIKSVAIKSAIQKIAIGIAFGYFAIKFIQDFEWGYLIWTAVQIGIFLLFGAISLFKSYLFVTDTQRQNRIKKINKIEQFNGTDKKRYIELEHQQHFKEETITETELTYNNIPQNEFSPN